MKVQIVLAFLAVLTFCRPAQCQATHYCGRDLPETLVKYCDFGETAKRSGGWMRTQLFGKGYWLAPQVAVALGRGKRMGGIATECCENPCTISELLAYCPE